MAQQIPANLIHPMRRNPLPTLLFYSVPIISLAPVGLLFHRPPKLSLTKQKSAKRFRKIGVTDSDQFDAPNPKKSSANASILPCTHYFPCTVWSTIPPTYKVVTDQTEVSQTVKKKTVSYTHLTLPTKRIV